MVIAILCASPFARALARRARGPCSSPILNLHFITPTFVLSVLHSTLPCPSTSPALPSTTQLRRRSPSRQSHRHTSTSEPYHLITTEKLKEADPIVFVAYPTLHPVTAAAKKKVSLRSARSPGRVSCWGAVLLAGADFSMFECSFQLYRAPWTPSHLCPERRRSRIRPSSTSSSTLATASPAPLRRVLPPASPSSSNRCPFTLPRRLPRPAATAPTTTTISRRRHPRRRRPPRSDRLCANPMTWASSIPRSPLSPAGPGPRRPHPRPASARLTSCRTHTPARRLPHLRRRR